MEKNSMNTNLLKVETLCPICGKYSTVVVRKKDYIAWNRGILLAQEAFPYLPAEDRKKLISGICPDCWDKMFAAEAPEKDEEEYWLELEEEEEEEKEETDWEGVFEALRNILKILEEKED